MKLKYTDLDQVKSDHVSINSLNGMLRKLVENDQTMISSLADGIGIWEKKWYNDDQILGYQAGQAVWINTEPLETFARNHQRQIVDYILNSKYKEDYQKISANNSDLIKFLEDICEGRNGYDRLYYLGNIDDSTQIRISLRDNNKSLPSDDNGWCDTLRLSSETDYRNEITSLAVSADANSILQHEENFHLSGMSVAELTSDYLLSSLSNLGAQQSYRTHAKKLREETMNGFDEVAMAFVDRSNNRWFRVWKSGYLEHGGQISVSGSPKTISVDLGWSYGGLKAPVYDFTVLYDQFYPFGSTLSVGGTSVTPRSDTLGTASTYQVDVTPCMGPDGEFSPAEIANIGNNGFNIVVRNGVNSYIYHTTGFITSTTLRRYL